MTKRFQISFKESVHYLSGPLEGESDMSVLTGAAAPLRLNLLGITSVSSLGIQNFMKFLEQWGEKPLDFQDCSVSFMMALNMIPALGRHAGSQRPIPILSLFIPYRCSACRKTVDIHAPVKALMPGGGKSLTEPKPACPSCSKTMTCEDDLRDYLQHLLQTA